MQQTPLNGLQRSSIQRFPSLKVPLRITILTTAFLAGDQLPPPSTVFAQADELLRPVRQTSPPENWKHWICEICENNGEPWIVVGGETEWNVHLRSRRHRTKERRIRKKEEFEEWKASKKCKETSDMSEQETDTIEC
jgi:tRNA dimethylallyltransferase